MESIDLAEERVEIRVTNGGHFVSKAEIKSRYIKGLENLNEHYEFFDVIQIFDTSRNNASPDQVVLMTRESIDSFSKTPDALSKYAPDLAKLIENQKSSIL